MATAKRRTPGRRTDIGQGRRSLALRVGFAALLLIGAVGFFYREPVAGYSQTGAAFGARTACSCRYVAGRELADCRKDFEPGMGIVFLSDDADAREVTAYVPLLASETARYSEGYGCVLDTWAG